MSIYYFILFGTGFLILYAYRAVKLVTAGMPRGAKWFLRISFLVLAIFVYATTSYLAIYRDEYRDQEWLRTYSVAGAITLNVTLVIISLFQLLGDIGLFLSRMVRTKDSTEKTDVAGRRNFMSKLALVLGGITLGAFAWGTTKGKYGWRILKNRLTFSNLPQSFDGMRIVQISDLHLGSFNHNYGPLAEAVEMVNELEPDYIVFTGDLVNEGAEEAEGWRDVFRGLKAKKGKYAVLGNHDYGWGRITEEDKDRISREVIDVLEDMDMRVLANEHAILEQSGEKIGLVGVENWGYSEENWFPTRGDYRTSVRGMDEVPFKILLSHDPTHWDHHILGKEAVDLTLSGHTHGGQMGLRIPGLVDLSAGRFFYKRYAGAYTEQGQHLYVNRGMGHLIFPGRVGMPPEITLHELYRG
jgi:hypothetical protein